MTIEKDNAMLNFNFYLIDLLDAGFYWN